MDKELTGWDIFFIVVSGILVLCLLVVIFLPLFQGLNPFKLMVGNVSEYNFTEDSEYRNSNILNGLLGIEDPSLYPFDSNKKDKYDLLNEKTPMFKHFNKYGIFIEAYNEPKISDDGIEIYGPCGFEIRLSSVKSSDEVLEMTSIIEARYPGYSLVPYYSTEIDESLYVSAIDLSSSSIKLEKYDGVKYETVARVSGSTWVSVMEENGGVCILRNPDGSMIFDGGEYKISLAFKQVMIHTENGVTVHRIMSPKEELHSFNVNEHECSNGIIIANNASQNMDVQLNVINDEKTVCYAPQSRVNVGKSLNLGVSFSEERARYILGNSILNSGLGVYIEMYRYDSVTDEYVLIENRKIMDLYSTFVNKTFAFEGEQYKSGRYKIIMKYGSRLERIEQDYEYYFVFEA